MSTPWRFNLKIILPCGVCVVFRSRTRRENSVLTSNRKLHEVALTRTPDACARVHTHGHRYSRRDTDGRPGTAARNTLANMSVALAPMLLKLAGRWLFSTPELDPWLLEAITLPLDRPVPERIACLFGADDPWQRNSQKLLSLAAFLSSQYTDDGPSRQVRTTEATRQGPLECRNTDSSKGRGLFATEAITPGQKLLQEPAHAAVLWPSHHRSHCHFCFRPLCRPRTAILCSGCKLERYCSSACATAAWREGGHSHECGSQCHAIAPRTVVLCVRALLADNDGVALLSLHAHDAAFSPAAASQLRFHSFVWFRSLQPDLTARGHTEATLNRLLRIALTNVFALSTGRREAEAVAPAPAAVETSAPVAVVEPINAAAIGEAFFPRASLLNHSCEPNTAISFAGRTLQLRAAVAVAKGSELLTSYGPEVGFGSVATRRAALRGLYFFECHCEACEREGARGDDGARPGRTQHGVWRERARRLDLEARRACEEGRLEEAAALSEEALRALKMVLAPGSPALAHEAAKAARLRFNAVEDAKGAARAAAALAQAATSLEECYGVDAEVQELRRLEVLCKSSR